MPIRSICTFLLLLVSTYYSEAQPKGFSAVQDKTTLQEHLKRKNTQINNIQSDFKQEKNLSLLADKISSSGKFSYAKEAKVRIEYTEPYSYLVVMNGTKMLVKDEQKTSKINTGNSKLMQSVNQVMLDCMRGTVLTNSDFNITTFKSSSQYLLQMIPATPEMKKLFDKIEVYLSKTDMQVEQLVMTELGGDYTTMRFFNTKYNTKLDEGLFKVK